MDYININLSDKKYEKTKKMVVINSGLFVVSILFFVISVINIVMILNMNSENGKKSIILNKKIAILTEKVKEQEKIKLKYEETGKKNNIDDKKKRDMENVFLPLDVTGVTQIFNKIEQVLPIDVIVTKFAMYEKKINITVMYDKEAKVMEFVNNLQKEFSDVFILENKNNVVNIEINI